MKNVYSLPFFLVFLLVSCASNEEPAAHVPGPEDVTTVINVDANITDINFKPAFHGGPLVDGNFTFEQHAFFQQGKGYDFASSWNKILYEGNGVLNCRVNGKSLCTSFSCDTTNFLGNGIWEHYSEKRPLHVEWEFINLNRDKRYKVLITELPEAVTLFDPPTVLSRSQDNVIHFQRSSIADSVLLEMITVPKANLTRTLITEGLIAAQYRFPLDVYEDHITLPAYTLKEPAQYAADTTFINVVSIRRVIKIIEGQKFGVNYQVNNIFPVSIRE